MFPRPAKSVFAEIGGFIVAACILAMPLPAAAENALTGNWARDDGSVRMAIVPCGGAYCATNTWVKDPNGTEHVGDRLVLSLSPISPTVFQGEAYDVRRQAHYKMTITVQGGTLHTTGCVLLGIVCKDAGWTRVNSSNAQPN
jgi:uncharacterized protein (DUF2147 family)